uniref:CBS domain-containing protein n=1 Tax=Heterorhabditis bacteriophora TaxID=37862 RepID=A0A1I7WWH0_HETBA
MIITGRLPAFPAVVFVGAHSALSSVWDAAKLICLNRVHRIPIVQLEETTLPDLSRRSQGDLLYILSLKTVFTETVLKLVPQTASCSDAIALFLDKKISSAPVVDSLNRVLGMISKSDVMSELVRHPNNYLEILDIPVMDLIANIGPCLLGTTTMTVYDTISTLVNTDRQSLVSSLPKT